jgi:glutamyl-tRNA reductase
VRPLADLPAILREVDAAIVCTGAHAPILVSADLPARPADRPLAIVDIGIPEQVERAPLPANVRVDGLDELTAYHRATGRRGVTCRDGEPEQLVERALNDLRAFCVQPVFSEILDSVQRNHAQTVREAIPRILAARLADVPEAVRAGLGQDLRAMLLEYTNDVFRTIRQAYGDTTCACKPDGRDDL